MTLQEIEAKKVELRNAINEAKDEEELNKLAEEVEAINNEVPEAEEKVEEETQPDGDVVEAEEVKEEGDKVEITPEEERSLLKDIDNIEQRSLKNLELKNY